MGEAARCVFTHHAPSLFNSSVVAALLGGISITLPIAPLGLHVGVSAAFVVSINATLRYRVPPDLALLAGIGCILILTVAIRVLHDLLHRGTNPSFVAPL